jgi:hypothetical protein
MVHMPYKYNTSLRMHTETADFCGKGRLIPLSVNVPPLSNPFRGRLFANRDGKRPCPRRGGDPCGPLTGRFFGEKAPRPRRGGGGEGKGGARSPGETTSLAVALRPSIDRDEGARSPGETTSARVPTPHPNRSRPYGDEAAFLHVCKKPTRVRLCWRMQEIVKWYNAGKSQPGEPKQGGKTNVHVR